MTTTPRAQEFEVFLSYWRELQAAGEPVPSRRSFNPMRLRGLLPFVYMLELKGPDEVFVRLSGTALDDASRRPMTGHNFLDLCIPEERGFYAGLAGAICGHPCGARMIRHATFQDGSSHYLREMGLPLRDRHGMVRYIIGLMSIQEDHAHGEGGQLVFNSSRIQNLIFIDIGAGIPVEGPALPMPRAEGGS